MIEQITRDYAHEEIHAGNSYQVSGQKDSTIDHCRDIQITVPATKELHLTLSILCEKETDIWLYEGVTIGLAGTTTVPNNRNRNSSNLSAAVVATIDNATVANATTDTPISAATALEDFTVIEGKQGGGAISERSEWVLAASGIYSFRFEATVAGLTSYWLNWYEESV